MVCAAGLSQDHLQLGGTGGISWGHWASRDFVVRFRVSDGMLPPQSSWPLALTHLSLRPCLRAFLQKWTSLPVAIWADQWYDGHAIFTGSATLDEHDNPIITYPGMCGCPPKPKGGGPAPQCDARVKAACRSGAAYSQAIPSNRSDPLLKNWSKPEYNPILNGTGDDPSTAWKTQYGEWRFIGNGGECADA
jgi:hypothetical protein